MFTTNADTDDWQREGACVALSKIWMVDWWGTMALSSFASNALLKRLMMLIHTRSADLTFLGLAWCAYWV